MDTAIDNPPAKSAITKSAVKAPVKATTPVQPDNTRQRAANGEYKGKVTLISVILTGDRPVIFTRVELLEKQDGDINSTKWDKVLNTHVTHAVRLKGDDPVKSAQSLRIGLNELRSAFPNELALLDNKALIIAMKNNTVLGHDVHCSVVPQLNENNMQVVLENGEKAFNVRLRSAIPMSDEVSDKLIDALLPSASSQTTKATDASNPFTA